MTLGLFLLAILVLSVDVFLMCAVAGFFQSKFNYKQLINLQFTLAFVVSFILFVGILIGKVFMSFYSELAVWYASTILFLLSLKLFYSGVRLFKLRKTINPTNSKGLLAITTSLSLNVFFIGMSFGFLNISNSATIYAFIVLVLAIVFGYVSGFKQKKLTAIRIELYEAIVYFIMAIFIMAKL